MSPTQLSIDTSGKGGSLAILRDQTLLKSFGLPQGKRTAATLAGRLQDAIRWCKTEHHAIDFVSIASGPGSFTGLRIGVTTAKVLCYATGWPLVAIDSVAAVAASVMSQHPNVDSVLVGLNAYRGQVFGGCFERQYLLPSLPSELIRNAESFQSLTVHPWLAQMNSSRVFAPHQWNDFLSATSDTTAIAGETAVFPASMLPRFQERTCDDALGVGLLGDHAALLKQWVDPMQLSPRYLKSSAAEELAAKRST